MIVKNIYFFRSKVAQWIKLAIIVIGFIFSCRKFVQLQVPISNVNVGNVCSSDVTAVVAITDMADVISRWLKLTTAMITLVFIFSCQKYVQVPAPISSINVGNVYSNDPTAIAAITDIYSQMSSGTLVLASGQNSLSYFAGLAADELTLYSGVTVSAAAYLYYTNALTNVSGVDFWNSLYPAIFSINSAIEGISGSTSLTPAIRQQLLGEAFFLRALCYFYLVNLYGDVPLVTGTDYAVNSLLARSPQATVWKQIIGDLQNAKALLSGNFLDKSLLKTSTSRLRPTKYTASALLARTYLYTADWSDAKMQADSLINNNAPFTLSLVSNLNNVFLANSNEAIWQLQPVSAGIPNTLDAYYFILPSTGPNGTNNSYLSTSLLNSFENGDQRRIDWVDSAIAGGTTYYYPYKYKVNATGSSTLTTEYTMVFRLSEQYLIRAEAEANGAGNGISSAISDLNVIRNRAGLAAYSGGTDQASVLAAILHERQVELFTEWGHRWLDLKRSGTINTVMAPVCNTIKGGNWSSNWQYFPIPLTDLQADPNLAQNSGY
jgi:hypothetical protein